MTSNDDNDMTSNNDSDHGFTHSDIEKFMMRELVSRATSGMTGDDVGMIVQTLALVTGIILTNFSDVSTLMADDAPDHIRVISTINSLVGGVLHGVAGMDAEEIAIIVSILVASLAEGDNDFDIFITDSGKSMLRRLSNGNDFKSNPFSDYVNGMDI